MSLFPKRAAPGQAVTVHLRHLLLPDGAPGLTRFTLQIFDPEGERVFHDERELLSFLPAMIDEAEEGEEVSERFAYTPLLLNFRRPVPDRGPQSSASEQELFELIHRGRERGVLDEGEHARMNALMATLVEQFAPPPATRRLALDMAVMRASSHFYWQWRVPEGARPGAYLIVISGPGSADLEASPTLHREQLFVDRPRLLELEERGGKLHAQVANDARVPVPVRLARPRSRGADTSLHELAAESTTPFELEPRAGLALLLYAEGTRALALSPSRAPVLTRRTGLALRRVGPSTLRLSLPPTQGPAPSLLFPALGGLSAALRAELDQGFVELEGERAQVLELADGLHQCDEIEARCGLDALAELEAAGLVRRVPLAELEGEVRA